MDLYVGVMSGTSIDGVDTVLVEFETGKVNEVGFCSVNFPEDLKNDLDMLVCCTAISLDKLGEIDHRLGLVYADCVNRLLRESGCDRSMVKAIGCHGQTIFHAPGEKYPFTMQIGNGNIVAAKTGIPVVCDFRRMDMAYNGQGAPLACGFHQYFLNSRDERRAILNMGGIANITILAENPNDVTGFDTGPANCLMDNWIRQCKSLSYDRDGEWAKSGKVIDDLLRQMLREPYFTLRPPKSTGRELFNMQWLQKFTGSYDDCDIQATLLELTVVTIANAVKAYDIDALYACGGGAFNRYLMERLAFYLPQIRISTTLELGIPVQHVEAIAFAWMAQRRLQHLPGNLPTVTGATNNAILGAFYLP